MKNKHFYILSLLFIFIFSIGCSRVKKPAAAEEREKWIESLNDSIADYKRLIDSTSNELNMIHSEIGELITEFEFVSNPKAVEGFYIYKGWKSKYPLSTTGMIARINESEGLELLATLKGGTFNRIEVSDPNETLTSETVEHDQALNYRTQSFNTVCYYGGKADSIAMMISDNMPDKITVEYLGSGKKSSIVLPSDQKEMIAATWQLYSRQQESKKLERNMTVWSHRIEVCRHLIERKDSADNANR